MAYAFGWKKQAPDDGRDLKLFTPRRITASLPQAVDLTANMGQLFNQGSLGSCGPNTSDEMIEYDQKAQGLPVVSASRLFIYWTTRYLMGGGAVNQDSGVDNRTMLKALNQYGFCPETLWPYVVEKFRMQPPQAAFAAAATNRITSYAAVPTTPDQMKGCLVRGFPFMFGFEVFQQIESDQAAANGILTTPPAGSTPIGGHDVTIFAYDESKQAYKFRNHWVNGDGSPWGDKGCGWIPYAYAHNANLCSDFWAINAVPGGVIPPPPPAPPPQPTPPPVPPVPGVGDHVTLFDAGGAALATFQRV